MFRIRLAGNINAETVRGETVAGEIQSEFRNHRPWHRDVCCQFEEGKLILCATNDFDKTRLALLDEFGDCLSAYLALSELTGDASVISVEAV
jgi:hypothetical protein